MELDVVLLSRAQFALTIMFHYLFPPLTIGLGVVLVYLEAMYLRTRNLVYESAARFWTQLFAVSFAIGVATGIVMEFQFGTNWARYSRFVGDVFGSALAAEGIFAFFLESGFLAVLVFGWDKVSAGFHFFASLMVALGSIFSAIWIIVANSWQQTPHGHHVVEMMRDGQPWIVDGQPVLRAETLSFWSVVFNPSTFDRLSHTLIGAFIMGSFFVMSISAYYLLRRRHEDFARRSFTGALIFATLFSLAQLVSGDSNARMVARQQPAKLAAFEGHFRTGPAALSAFGYPDVERQQLRGSLAVPGALSLLVARDPKASVLGLDAIPRQFWPPVGTSYQSFHVMVALGMFFIALTLYASWQRYRRKLFEKRWLLAVFVVAVIGPVAANQLGWVAAEVGRQPWTVHAPLVRDAAGMPALDAHGKVQYVVEQGLLTAHSVSESVTGSEVVGSIAMFGVIYALLFAIWVFVLNHKIHLGPEPIEVTAARTTARGLRRAAAERTLHEGSLSEAKEPPAGGKNPP